MLQQRWFLTLWEGPKSRVWLTPIFRTRLAEKREEEEEEEEKEEHRQLQSVMRFTQTQKDIV